MINIRNLSFFDIFKLKKFVSNVSNEEKFNYLIYFVFYPLMIINQLMPIFIKFFPEIYTISQNDKIKGFMIIQSRKNNPYKWEIKQFLISDNSYELGEQLINYVVSKYAAKGVETILAKVNPDDKNKIDMFSKSCGFRYCLDYQYFLIKTAYYKNRVINSENCIYRPFKDSDAKGVTELYNQNISQYYKFPLSKIPKEYQETAFKGLSKKMSAITVLEDKFSKQIRGYLKIETENNYNYILEIVLLPSFEYYFEDMITYAISQIIKRVCNFDLYFKNNKFHINSETFEKTINEIDNELKQTDMIFAKDFFKKIKDIENVPKSSIIYNEFNGKPVYKM